MEYNKLKILITGGAGFIGSNISNKLITLGCNVIVYDNLSRGNFSNLIKNPKLHLVKADINNYEKLIQKMKKCDYIFHQAALHLKGCEENPTKCITTNINGSFNVFKAAVKSNVKKIIIASSSSVYGSGYNKPAKEDDLPNSENNYAASKVAMEELCKSFYKKFNLNYTILRYLNVYGPGQHITSSYTNVINHFLIKILKNNQPIINGDGKNTLDLIYIDDIVRANIFALSTKSNNEILNIGTGKQIKIIDLLKKIQKITKTNLKPKFLKTNNNLIKHRTTSVYKAMKKLDFKPKYNLDQGLTLLIKWYKLNT
ncbi:MAG: SDR family NAD(P)-dependent oxidoreductase [bacterium]|nr:SDR family NAD(P)-dependent oxidoreductase [bacterium]